MNERFGSRATAAQTPRTAVGYFLRAAMLNQPERRNQLARTLGAWNDDDPAVVEAVCERVVRRYFSDPREQRLISDLVTELVDGIQDLDSHAMEAVIRAALGMASSGIEDVSPADRYVQRVILAGVVSVRLGLGAADVDRLIAEGERIAMERGWNPRPAAGRQRERRRGWLRRRSP